MIYTSDELNLKYAKYANPARTIRQQVKKGKLFPLIRGLYVDEKEVANNWLAECICNPSYISFDWALSFYDIIPEAVYTITSATFGKNKHKVFRNDFGTFYYFDIPEDVYFEGVDIFEENGYIYHVAKPEKAVLDKLYQRETVHSKKELLNLMFWDMRMDVKAIRELDYKWMIQMCPKYKSKNLNLFKEILEDEINGKHFDIYGE